MWKKLEETVEFIKKQNPANPEVGIILGTGLSELGTHINPTATLSYEDIPNFPVSTVTGHAGRLIFGTLGGKEVVAMQGRFHYYEGYSMEELTFPVRIMKLLGVKLLIVSNASGGLHPDFEIGDLMIIRDHINLMPANPLIGPNDERLGPRFPDMSETYEADLIHQSQRIARSLGIKVRTGVYAAVTGPNFETPAEYKYLHIIGADAVGMSTVPEVLAARHMGMKVFAVSVISDLGVEGKIVEISHQEVINAASQAEPRLTALITQMIAGMD